MKALLNIAGILIGGLLLILVIWQPVFPSKFLVYGMASKIKETCSSLEAPVTVRFELSGRGGGIFNIVADKNDARVVEGEDTERLDAIMYMTASDFNSLMFQLATGKADEYTIQGLVVANFLDIAGDMTALAKLMGQEQ